MELEAAIKMLRNVVKNAGSVDYNHIDLGLVSTEDRPQYEKALIVTQLAVKEGKLSRDELLGKLHLS